MTEATHESQLSVRLRPLKKWSYRKVILRAALASIAFVTAYIHSVMTSSTPVSSLGAVSYLVLRPLSYWFVCFSYGSTTAGPIRQVITWADPI